MIMPYSSGYNVPQQMLDRQLENQMSDDDSSGGSKPSGRGPKKRKGKKADKRPTIRSAMGTSAMSDTSGLITDPNSYRAKGATKLKNAAKLGASKSQRQKKSNELKEGYRING